MLHDANLTGIVAVRSSEEGQESRGLMWDPFGVEDCAGEEVVVG